MNTKEQMIKDVEQAIELYHEIHMKYEDPIYEEACNWLKSMKTKLSKWSEDNDMFMIWALVRQNAIYEIETPWNPINKLN